MSNPDKTIPEKPPEPGFSRARVELDFMEAFEAFLSPRVYENVARHFRPDGELTCNCPPSLLQLGGTHRGIENILAALRSFFTEFRVTGTAVDDIVIDGSHVVVTYQLRLRHVGTGRAGVVGGMNHYVLDEDRKLTKASIFLDNASLAVVGDLLESFVETTRGLEAARATVVGPRK